MHLHATGKEFMDESDDAVGTLNEAARELQL